MIKKINHTQLGVSRLVTQFRESLNLIAYLKVLLNESDTLEDVFFQILNDRWLDTAEGVQLDILGAIVGQPRIVIDAVLVKYFGFVGHLSALSFGSLKGHIRGSGRFRGLDEPLTGSRTLTDREYRVAIKARIVKNSIVPTVPAMIDFFKFLFGEYKITISEGVMSYTLTIGRTLTKDETLILITNKLIPKVAAVKMIYKEHK